MGWEGRGCTTVNGGRKRTIMSAVRLNILQNAYFQKQQHGPNVPDMYDKSGRRRGRGRPRAAGGTPGDREEITPWHFAYPCSIGFQIRRIHPEDISAVFRYFEGGHVRLLCRK